MTREEKISEDEFNKMEETGIARLNNMERPMLFRDIQKTFRFLNFEYSGLFRGMHKRDHEGNIILQNWKLVTYYKYRKFSQCFT